MHRRRGVADLRLSSAALAVILSVGAAAVAWLAVAASVIAPYLR